MVAHNRKNKIKQNNGLNLLFHSFPKLNLRCKDRKHIQFALHIHQTVTSNKMNPVCLYTCTKYPHLLKTRKLDEQTNQWTRLQIQNNIYTTNRVLVKQNTSPLLQKVKHKYTVNVHELFIIHQTIEESKWYIPYPYINIITFLVSSDRYFRFHEMKVNIYFQLKNKIK